MLPHANACTREPVPASHITVGPAVRRLGRLLGHHRQSGAGRGGRPAGPPRRHGDPVRDARDLRRRAPADAARRLARGRREADRRASSGGRTTRRANKGEMNNNPSPGNKAGGLTTILEKSLGAVAKGGTTNLVDVYEYAEPVTAKGFVYMDTPGYDPVSATGQVAGGANMIVLHHRPRLGVRLRAVAVAQARRPTPRCGCGRKRTSTSTAARSSTAPRASTRSASDSSELMLDTASGSKTQERAARLRTERIRAVVPGRGDVSVRRDVVAIDSARQLDTYAGARRPPAVRRDRRIHNDAYTRGGVQ